MEIVNSFKRYLKTIVPNIVYKSVKQAEDNETMETQLRGDEYVGACLQVDNFMSYREFSVKVLNQAGINDIDLIAEIQRNPDAIPFSKRDKVVEFKRKEVIENFEEQNNYYRMLAGLPDVDAGYVYLSPDELMSYGYRLDSQEDYDNDELDKLTPIHKLPQDVLNGMDKTGYLEEVYQNYASDPNYNAEYIHHLGLRRVSIVNARTATQYELLYVPRPDNANRFNRDFILYYEEARQYFLNQVYNYHFSADYDYYEGYIGFFILVMSIQRMVDSLFEVMVERDFYDNETCRMFLEAYGVPFVEIFSFNQQKTLVKNLNLLLMNKCTSQVLYDLLGLLDYDTFDLTKYLLVKQHKTEQLDDESEPKPIFIYKTVLDASGKPSYEIDKSAIYDYYFVGVDMNEKDIKLQETTDINSHRYKDVTEDDPLWIEDSELINKLQESEINYSETKYTNISIILRMQKIMFEHVYLQKMICDKGSETSNIRVEIPLITPIPISLLEMEVILICLTCKHNLMVPDLFASPSKILPVLGFNFDNDLEAIKQDIINHPRIYDQKLITYIKNIYFNSAADVNEMYGNVRALADLLIEGMQTTASEKVYHAYKKLYQTMLVTDVHNEVFQLPDGSLPETYMDWLEYYDHDVYDYIDKLSPDACVDKINYIVTKMETMFTNTKYLKYLNPIDLTVVNGILRLLRWFKSYTLDIRDLEVVYLFDSRYYNLMKLMSRLYFHANINIRELDIGYHEWVHAISAVIKKYEKDNRLKEVLRMSASMTSKDFNAVLHDTFKLVATLHATDYMASDYIEQVMIRVFRMVVKDRMTMTDTRRPLKFIVLDE